MKNVDYAIAGTDSAALIWRDKGYTGPLEVIPQFGVDPNLFYPASRKPKGPFTIGYFGRLVEEKGLHLLLDAVARLDNSNWQLKIVGSGPQRGALEAQANCLGLRDHVCFYDRIPSVEIAAHYHGLDVFVLPSLTRPNWKEQFGRVLLEAMSSGIAVIGSDSGAIPDVVGQAGVIFPEGDVLALTRHLRDLQLQPDWRNWLGEQGRERVLKHYTHRRVAEATVEIYQTLADSLP
ncbi:MAG: glycosyltransferase family 4 protein [Anaerolineae bacterium]|nr:glycosyltransferase family 4 protein [Anaerolineae bacterium]